MEETYKVKKEEPTSFLKQEKRKKGNTRRTNQGKHKGNKME